MQYKIGEISHIEDVPVSEGSDKKYEIRIHNDVLGDIASQIKGTSAKMTVCLLIYSGKKKVGSSSVTIKVNILEDEEFKPKISDFTVSPNPSDKLGGVFVKGHTQPNFKFKVDDAGLGSTLNKCIIEENYNDEISTINFTPEIINEYIDYHGKVFNKDGSFSYSLHVKNKRGFTSNTVTSNSITVYDYYSPSVDMVSAVRDAVTSTNIVLKFQCSFAPVNNGKKDLNSAKVTIEYQSENSSWVPLDNIWDDDTLITSNKVETIIVEGCEENLSYNFRVTIVDAVGESASRTSFTPRYDILLHYPENQKGFGIGKYVDNGNFEVGLESEFFENVSMKQNLEIDGLISGENFGRFVYNGKDNCIETMGKLSSCASYKIRIFVVKPFNFAYLRMYIKGLDLEKNTNKYTMLCALKKEFKPAWYTPFAVSGGMNCDIMLDTKGELRVIPWNDINGDTSNIYIAGFYPLAGESPLYVQNASKIMTLD